MSQVYIDMNTEPRKNVKKDLKNDFLKLLNNAVSEKTKNQRY